MAKKEDIIKKLNGQYFWDVDTSKMDPETSKRLIIERVFSLGDIKDMRRIIAYYGRKKVADELAKLNYLDPKTFNFVTVLFDKSKQDYKCYTPKRSIPQHWNS